MTHSSVSFGGRGVGSSLEKVILFYVKTVFFNTYFFFLTDFSSHTFCDHAGLKYMGSSYNTSLPEDRREVWMMDILFPHTEWILNNCTRGEKKLIAKPGLL